jgi:hypothetical protein
LASRAAGSRRGHRDLRRATGRHGRAGTRVKGPDGINWPLRHSDLGARIGSAGITAGGVAGIDRGRAI